jgi:phospholipase D-like protein
MLRVLVYAIPLILGIYALVDCIQTEDSAVRGLPKLAWVAVIVLLWIVGPIAWLLAGRDRSRVQPGTPRPAGPGGGLGQGRPTRRIVAPDDDPDFLQQLTRDRRRREEEDRRGRSADPGTPGPDLPDDDDPGSGTGTPAV